jgi:hypothetical protein
MTIGDGTALMTGEIGREKETVELIGRLANEFEDNVGDDVAERCPEDTGLSGVETGSDMSIFAFSISVRNRKKRKVARVTTVVAEPQIQNTLNGGLLCQPAAHEVSSRRLVTFLILNLGKEAKMMDVIYSLFYPLTGIDYSNAIWELVEGTLLRLHQHQNSFPSTVGECVLTYPTTTNIN